MTDDAWHPIARSDDVPFRHVFHGLLLGRELAVWRADDGFVNVWENRCLHRGVRLSIGLNEGQELKCQYHGWRYANRTAGCTYIPAHPADSPARMIRNISFPAVERWGLVWSGTAPAGEPAGAPVGPTTLVGATPFGLRNLPINAEPDAVIEELAAYRPWPATEVTGRDATWIELSGENGGRHHTVVLFVQPVDSARSVVRGLLIEPPAEQDRLRELLHHHRTLSRLRDDIERRAATRALPPPIAPSLQRVRLAVSTPQDIPATPSRAPRVVVARKSITAEAICSFELRRRDGQLPTFQPGAHIDVHLPNGMTRQYSLVNGPGELEHYVIGVKREPDSRGGSACLHDDVHEGDVLTISEPHNNFPLRRDSFRTILIAGGIGVTPLLAMAQALQADCLPFDLHYFAQSADHLAFVNRLGPLGAAVITHLGYSPRQTAETLAEIMADGEDGGHVYLCGPGPMLDAARAAAATAGWPDHAVHFEYFKNTTAIDTSSTFTVELARSAMTLPVPPGTSILDALRSAGVSLPSSCEQGACGTCIVDVLAGVPDHQDVYLSASERATNSRMLTCVSRSLGERLVLDV